MIPSTGGPPIAWQAIAPILALVGGGVLLLLWSSIERNVARWKLALGAMLSIGVSGGLIIPLVGDSQVGMNDMIVIDGVGLFSSMIILLSAALVIPVSHAYLRARRIHRAEYYPLMLFAAAGMVLLATANDLLMIFIAIETLSLPLYVLVGMAKRDEGSQEASLKYFLLGAFSSAVLLYGVALLYGATATTRIPEIADAIAAGAVDLRLILVSLTLLLVGLAFKVGAAPFHMWTPDVYQGAPTSVTAFMAAGTKAAAFAALIRTLMVSFGTLAWDWRPVLWAVAVLTMVVGSLVAIVQTDVKRMLGYSSVAHAGFVLIGVVAATGVGISGALFYLLVYAVMTIGAFVAVMLSGQGGVERLELASWAGLGRRQPLFAGVMTLFLLSLAGIPPTGGFMAKLIVLSAAGSVGETALVVIAAVVSVVAAFFYLRLIVLMWLHDPETDVAPTGVDLIGGWTLGLAAAFIVVAGVYPQFLLDLARRAAELAG